MSKLNHQKKTNTEIHYNNVSFPPRAPQRACKSFYECTVLLSLYELWGLGLLPGLPKTNEGSLFPVQAYNKMDRTQWNVVAQLGSRSKYAVPWASRWHDCDWTRHQESRSKQSLVFWPPAQCRAGPHTHTQMQSTRSHTFLHSSSLTNTCTHAGWTEAESWKRRWGPCIAFYLTLLVRLDPALTVTSLLLSSLSSSLSPSLFLLKAWSQSFSIFSCDFRLSSEEQTKWHLHSPPNSRVWLNVCFCLIRIKQAH